MWPGFASEPTVLQLLDRMGARYHTRPSVLVGLDGDDPAAMALDYMAFRAGAKTREGATEGSIGVVVTGVL